MAEKQRRSLPSATTDRLGVLQEVSHALAGVLDAAEATRIVVEHAAAAIGASSGGILLIDHSGSTLELVRHLGVAPAVVEQFRRIPLDAPLPLTEALRHGRAVIVESLAEGIARYPLAAETIRSLGDRSFACLPLVARSGAIGGLALTFKYDRGFDPDERDFLLTLAHVCTLALESARMHEAEARARAAAARASERTGRLQQVTSSLSRALTPDEVATVIVSEASAALGAVTGVVGIIADDDRGTLQVLRADGQAQRAIEPTLPLESARPICHAARTGEPVWVPTRAEAAARYPSMLPIFVELKGHSAMALPLVFESSRLGALGFMFPEENGLDEADRAFLLTIAHHCAQALERARLYQSAERARAETEREHSRLVEIVRQSPYPVVVYQGAEHRIMLANPSWRTLVPNAEQLIGLPLADAMPQLSALGVIEVFDSIYRTGEPRFMHELPYRFYRNGADDPEQTYFDAVFSPLVDADGSIYGIIAAGIDVTFQVEARRRLEEEIAARRASEERCRFLADAVPQVVFTLDADGVVEYCNRRWYEYTGLGETESLGTVTGWQRALHPDDVAPMDAQWAAVFESGGPFEFEYRLRAKDGSYRWHLGRAAPLKDSAGRVIKWFGTATNVDDQRRVAEERARLAERAAFLADAGRLLASSLDYPLTLDRVAHLAVPELAEWCMVDLIDERGGLERVAVAHADPAKTDVARALGRRSVSPAHGEPAFGAYGTQGRSQLLRDVDDETIAGVANDPAQQAALRAMGVRSVISVPLLARGRVIGTLTLASGARNFDDGDLALARELGQGAAFAIDNARLYRDAQELLVDLRHQTAELERWDQLFQHASWGVAIASPDGILHAVNPAFAAMHGFAGEELVGRPLRALIARESQAELVAHRRIVNEQGHHVYESIHVRKDGSKFPVLTDVVVFKDERGRVLYGAANFQDISDRKRAERDRAELLEREKAARAVAEQASRMKDEFLATLSHELRTPLNAVLGWANMLRRGALDEGRRARALETIERNARQQAQLIDDILDVSRIIAGKLRIELTTVDLSAIVEAAADVVRPAAAAKELHLAVDAGVAIAAVADGARLQQVVWNLLSNAIKFTPRGGRVELRVIERAHEVELRVSDDGQGIGADFLPHVFDRFRQADSSTTRPHGGLGLGLSIVRHLVELHGGTVLAESVGDGRGATFTVRLPRRTQPEAPPDPERRPSAEPTRLEGLRVLIVDDEADARELLTEVLRSRAAEVRAAGSAEEALALIDEQPPHVLVSDIGMPGTDGLELIRRLRQRSAERGGCVPAVALTAYASGEDSRRAMLAGYQLHVPKPVEPDRLAQVVNQLAGWHAE